MTSIISNTMTYSRDIFKKYVFDILPSWIIVIVIIVIYIKIGLASNDPKAFTGNFNYNIFLIVLPIIAILSFILLNVMGRSIGSYILIASIIAISIFGAIFYFLQTTLSSYLFNSYLLTIVVILASLIGFTIIFTLLSGALRKLPGWIGFVANLIFYIPCLIRDGISALINEYNSFSLTLFILFCMELLLLLMYFFLIPYVNRKIVPEKIVLLEDPQMLNTTIPIDISKIDKSNNNFSLSMWVYVNPGSSNKIGYLEETDIFVYEPAVNPSDDSQIGATPTREPYIRLTYKNSPETDTLFNLYIGNTNLTNIITGDRMYPIKLMMPMQKWNNIVFNYVTTSNPVSSTGSNSATVAPTYSSTVDIFINGILQYSCPINTTPTFSVNNTMYIGSGQSNRNHDGLYGAICNIIYYKKPITKLALIYNYNTLIIKNPPL